MEQDYVEKASKYLMNTYGQMPIVLEKGKGVTLTDVNGKSYIDFTSGIGVNSLGFCDNKWVDAVCNQARSIAHTSNIYYNIPEIKLAEKIVTESNMSRVFFANSGAEANECAIKLARKYSFDKYGKGRCNIITLKKSFHGRTITTLSATGQNRFHNYFFPFTEGFKFAEANNIEEFKNAADNSVCAVMLEAIQGEGGVHPLDPEFVKEVASICREKDILLIFDEVQCGIGRCGHLFACEYFDVKPDIITSAKGLAGGIPIGAVLCTDKLKDVFVPGDHGSTFGGNPIATAAALVVLDRICNEKFMESVREKGKFISGFFEKKNLANVVEVRGMGLMQGIEIKGSASEVQKKAASMGLLVLTAGPNVVRLLPPLVIDMQHLEEGLNILAKAIEYVK